MTTVAPESTVVPPPVFVIDLVAFAEKMYDGTPLTLRSCFNHEIAYMGAGACDLYRELAVAMAEQNQQWVWKALAAIVGNPRRP